LAGLDSLRLGRRRFTLIGGVAVDSGFRARLTRDPELLVSLALPTDTLPAADSAGQVVSELTVPFVAEGESAELQPARIVVRHSLASLGALRRGVNLAFLAAVAVTVAIALVLGGAISVRISRPLAQLAQRTSEIDMDRLDVAFHRERRDQVGALTRLPGAVRAGRVPIASSISYLGNRAPNYARLSPPPARELWAVNEVVLETIRRVGEVAGRGELRIELADGLPAVRTDPLVLRRILENLIGNALDSLESHPGAVTILTARGADGGRPIVRITVADTGRSEE